MIQQHISRGFIIPIAIKPSEKFLRFNKSDVPIQHEDCVLDGTEYDHAASIIGYGFKYDVPVWVVSYPKGTNWGYNGRIYLEIGKNSFCSEMYAYGWVSKYYSTDEPLQWQNFTRGYDYSLDVDKSEFGTWTTATAGDLYHEEEETIFEEYEEKQIDLKRIFKIVGSCIAVLLFGICWTVVIYKKK